MFSPPFQRRVFQDPVEKQNKSDKIQSGAMCIITSGLKPTIQPTSSIVYSSHRTNQAASCLIQNTNQCWQKQFVIR